VLRAPPGQELENRSGNMDTVTVASIVIAFLGLLCLMIGYSVRDRNYGPFLLWAGVMAMIGVVVHHILRTLQVLQ